MNQPKDRAQELAEKHLPCDRDCDYKDGSHWHDCRVHQQDNCFDAIREHESELHQQHERELAAVGEGSAQICESDCPLIVVDGKSCIQADSNKLCRICRMANVIRSSSPNHAEILAQRDERITNELTVVYSCPHMLRYPECSICSPKGVRLAALEEAAKVLDNEADICRQHAVKLILYEMRDRIRALMEKTDV